MLNSLFVQDGFDTILFLQVKTRQNRNQIRIIDQKLCVCIKDPPIKGKANKSITKLLKKILKTEITFESGHTGKNKVFRVHNLVPNQVQELIQLEQEKLKK